MSNALKIEIMTSFSGDDPVYGETLYFDEDETRSILVTNNAECQILESMKQHPQVNDGSKYEDPDSQRDAHIVTVNIFHAYSSTKTNLTTLFSYKNLFKVYYKYITDPTAYYLCILDPNRSEKYTSGFEEAEIVTTLKFYETYNFKADGTAYLTNGISVTPEVIIDPDDKNIRLDGNTDIISISPIIQRIDFSANRIGIIENNDMSVTICNPLNYARPYNNYDTSTTWNPFRFVKSQVRVVYSGAVNYISVSIDTSVYDCEMRFKVGDEVRLVNDNGEYEDKIITSISTQSYNYSTVIQKLYFDSNLAYTYDVSSIVQTWSIIGKTVIINLRYDIEDYYGNKTVSVKQIYKGVARNNISASGNKASIYLESFMNSTLNKIMTIKASSTTPLLRCNSSGTLVDSRVWTTKTGSGVLADITIYNDASLGKWELTFSSAIDFTVNGPSCPAKVGSTASDFYDKTDATDSQIKIASSDWSGTPASGDIYEFYVSANFESLREAQIVRDILIVYGEITAGTDESIDITGLYDMSISFYEEITIGSAISTILQASSLQLTETYDGKYKLSYFSEYNYERTPVYFPYVLYYADYIKNGSVLRSGINVNSVNDIYDTIVLGYAWDYDNSVYSKTYTSPLIGDANKSTIANGIRKTLLLNCPGIYDENSIRLLAIRLSTIFGFPQYSAEIKINMQSLLNNIEIGSIYKVNSYCGALGLFVTEKEIDINNNKIILRGTIQRKLI